MSLCPWALNLKKLAKRFNLPFLPFYFDVFILFPSLGVWAMRTRLRYYVQPLYQTESTGLGTDQLQAQNFLTRRASSFRQAQRLREKLQNQIVSVEAAPKR